MLDQFDYTGSRTDAGIEWMQLNPRAAESDFEHVRLGFDGERLVQIELDDRLGPTDPRVTLSNIELAENYFAEDTFQLRSCPKASM